MYMNSLISATRLTTVYGADVTVAIPGSSFTTMGPDAFCETCPDACYVDFKDYGIPDAEEQNGTFPINGTHGYNSTRPAMVPAPVIIADTNFENDTGHPLTSLAWSANVTAVIAQSNDSTPLTAQSGQSYLEDSVLDLQQWFRSAAAAASPPSIITPDDIYLYPTDINSHTDVDRNRHAFFRHQRIVRISSRSTISDLGVSNYHRIINGNSAHRRMSLAYCHLQLLCGPRR
ncbi:hypothetical protein KCU95_g8477, partial [Aureobasidium melanogenum]